MQTRYRGWDGEKMLEVEDLTMSPLHRKWLGKIDVKLMPSTGNFDNSKELFAEDIVRVISGNPFKKRFKSFKAIIKYVPEEMKFMLVSYDENQYAVKERRKSYHAGKQALILLGNRFENPELMEDL